MLEQWEQKSILMLMGESGISIDIFDFDFCIFQFEIRINKFGG